MGLVPSGRGGQTDIVLERVYYSAKLVHAILTEARAYLQGRAEQSSSPGIWVSSGLEPSLLARASDTSEAWGGVGRAELAYATLRTVDCGWQQATSLPWQLRDEKEGLRALAHCAIAVRMLQRWKKERVATDLPPVELVAFHLAGHWGRIVDMDNREKVARHVMEAFSDDDLSMADSRRIVEDFRHHRTTPAWTLAIAETAVELARSNRKKHLAGCEDG